MNDEWKEKADMFISVPAGVLQKQSDIVPTCLGKIVTDETEPRGVRNIHISQEGFPDPLEDHDRHLLRRATGCPGMKNVVVSRVGRKHWGWCGGVQDQGTFEVGAMCVQVSADHIIRQGEWFQFYETVGVGSWIFLVGLERVVMSDRTA